MQRSAAIRLLACFLGAGLLAVAVVGLARPLIDDPAGREAKTHLDERIETAREIRRALATPIPPPEPLQPITAKPLHGQNPKRVGGDDSNEPRKAPKLSRGARDAMAREQRRSRSSSRSTEAADR